MNSLRMVNTDAMVDRIISPQNYSETLVNEAEQDDA